jgi:putative membrane protein insertion efficiency factor
MTFGRRMALCAIRGYQLLLAPFSGGACRFEPSCSSYALEAVQLHGALYGSWLAIRRLTRCHPLSRPGIDPVPPPVHDRGVGAAAKTRS